MKPFDFLRRKNRQFDELTERVRQLEANVDSLREAIGRIEARQSAANPTPALREHEFRVFSQWGEDGIIDHLVRHVAIPRRFFVEFGVETYREANTRFLLTHQAWHGLILDGNERDIATIRKDPICWRHHLAVAHAFITRENINELLEKHGAAGPIGLLSIDVDGNDYWIWEAITVSQPAIVVMEYNALLGSERAVTIPYDPAFSRATAHWSHLYMGASLPALVRLGTRKGYAFVGTNRAGNNAFFIEKPRLPAGWRELTVAEGFTPPQFREARNEKGQLAYYPAEEAAKLIAGLPLVEVPE
jgi:hypothetical protein